MHSPQGVAALTSYNQRLLDAGVDREVLKVAMLSVMSEPTSKETLLVLRQAYVALVQESETT